MTTESIPLQWTAPAEEALEAFFARRLTPEKLDGADAAEVREDLRAHLHEELRSAGVQTVTLDALQRALGTLGEPLPEVAAHSRAWDAFCILKPKAGAGWQFDREHGVWVCHVEQGHYGHASRKATWLIACGMQRGELPELEWTKGEQRLPQWMIDRYGYEKARRIGVVAMVGGKNKTRIRNTTPVPFRDVLIDIARSAA